jgi:hypothetical protein
MEWNSSDDGDDGSYCLAQLRKAPTQSLHHSEGSGMLDHAKSM